MFLRDFVQAYTQTQEEMKRIVYMRPSPFLGFEPDVLLRLEHGLYGLSVSGLLWFKTYHQHHSKTLKLKRAVNDQCLLYTPDILSTYRPQIHGITCLQTDDNLHIGTEEFQRLEEKASKTFKNKPIEEIKEGLSKTLNRTLITQNKLYLNMNQPIHVQKIKILDPTSFTKATFVSERAKGA